MSCVLITGATGVIGSELVPLYLTESDWSLRLLVRGETPTAVKDRLKDLADYW
ncbi:MAG: SDR family oxidoreductase, partial [Planctomycetota bacterium]